jgi:hypothetical protein
VGKGWSPEISSSFPPIGCAAIGGGEGVRGGVNDEERDELLFSSSAAAVSPIATAVTSVAAADVAREEVARVVSLAWLGMLSTGQG